MFEKGKLSFWDIGTYLTIGFFASLLFVLYCVHGFELSAPTYISKLKDFSATIAILTPILLLLIGMIIEPFANTFIKEIEKIKIFTPKKGRSIEKIVEIVDKKLPKSSLIDIRYRYCKSIVELKFPNSNHEIFLARFGFYRSLSFIFICILIANFFVKNLSCTLQLINIINLYFAYISLRRSQLYKSHMEYSVYINYLAVIDTDENNKCDKNA